MIATALACLALAPTYGLMKNGDRWWFKDPQGKPFWSFGVDCVDPGISWSEWNPQNRGYSADRLFENGKAWVDHVQTELPSMGMNSLGGWSEIELFQKFGGQKRLPYFVVLHLGAYDRAPWHDLFAKQMEDAVDGAAKEQIGKIVNDPYLVGYFSDNELGWWDDTLFLSYLSMKGTPGQRKLIETAKAFYKSDFKKLLKDWNVTATSFAGLATTPAMTLKTGGTGIQLVAKWNEVLAERYYSLMHRTIKKYDSKRLILGDRYLQYYNFATARASRKYVDAISTNYGADWNDGTMSRFFLDSLHKITGKPVIITEFYMGATENRSGNKNSGTAFPKVQTQEARAKAFGKNIEEFASLPYVIGAHWFQYFDEPEHGRPDGEDWNMGLVDIDGKPYELMANAARQSEPAKTHREARPLPACSVVPEAPANPMKSLRDWDRRLGFVAPNGQGIPHGDLYMCQDKEFLYVGLFASDYIDKKLYPKGIVPETERASLYMGGPSLNFTVRFGADRKVVCDKGYEVSEIVGLRHTVIVRVPKAKLPVTTPLYFFGRAQTHSRGNKTQWIQEVSLR